MQSLLDHQHHYLSHVKTFVLHHQLNQKLFHCWPWLLVNSLKRQDYQREQQAELIRQLEELVQQLNTQYTQDTQEESTRRSWFFS